MIVSVDSWSLHPDFWECRPGVNYVVAYRRARRLASVLAQLAVSEAAPTSLLLAVELYGAAWAVCADGTAIAWIGPGPDDAELWAQLGPDEPVPLDFGGLADAA